MSKSEKPSISQSERKGDPIEKQEATPSERRAGPMVRARSYFREAAKHYAPDPEDDFKANPGRGFIESLGEDLVQLASERGLAKFKKFPEDREQLADALAFLAGRLGAQRESEIGGYENFDDDIKQEAITLNKETQALFTATGEALFPQHFDDQQAIEGWLSGADESVRGMSLLPSARIELARLLASRQQGPEILAAAIDRSIINLARIIENSYNLGQVSPDEQDLGIPNDRKQDVLEAVEFIYQLQVARDVLWRSTADGKNPLDAKRLDELKTEILGKKDLMTFNEVVEALKDATTIEMAKRAVTPEIMESARSLALADIDSSIAQAEQYNATHPDEVLNKKTVGAIFGVGIRGVTGSIYQKIGAAKFGRVMIPDEIARMSIVDFMKTFFDYDLVGDRVRVDKLRRYTNVFM